MKKTLTIIGIIVAVIVVAAAIYFALQDAQIIEKRQMIKSGEVPAEMLENKSPDAARATQNLLDEARQREEERQAQEQNQVEGVGEVTGEDIVDEDIVPKTIAITPGSSQVDLLTGDVLNVDGEVADNTAESGSPVAPQVSVPLGETDVPTAGTTLEVTSSGFTPSSFTVTAGQAVALTVKNVGNLTEIFRFDEESLSAVALGLAPGETRSITFTAPEEAGEYTFFSDIANHQSSGAEGVMIVQ